MAAGFGAGCEKAGKESDEFEVVAMRLSASSMPTADQIAPYHEALTVAEYKVVERLSETGSAPGKGDKIRVAHWAVAGGVAQAIPEPVEGHWKLTLVPLDSVPGLDKVPRRDDLAFDPEGNLFLDLSQSLALPEAPKQIRYDYRGPISRRMEIFWLTRAQLRLAVIGNSHAGVGVDPRQFFQPENESVPVALNLSVAGSELPLQRHMIEEYLLDLPRLEWIVWGVSPRIFNVHHAHDRREEIFRSSPGYLYDQKNRDFLRSASEGEKPKDSSFIEESVDREIEPWGWSPATWRELPVPLTEEARNEILSACRRPHFEWNAEAWDAFAGTVEAATDRGIRVLLFTPPYHPLVSEGKAADFNGTGHTDYRMICDRLRDLADENDRLFFIDLHKGGAHDFSPDQFANPDHLHESGARKLTARLVEQIDRVPRNRD